MNSPDTEMRATILGAAHGSPDPFPWLDEQPTIGQECIRAARGFLVGISVSVTFWALMVGAYLIGQR